MHLWGYGALRNEKGKASGSTPDIPIRDKRKFIQEEYND